MSPEPAVDQRLARPHGDAPETQFHALIGESRTDKVMLADRGAAERHEHIGFGLARGEDGRFERGEIVAWRCQDRSARRRPVVTKAAMAKEFEATI